MTEEQITLFFERINKLTIDHKPSFGRMKVQWQIIWLTKIVLFGDGLTYLDDAAALRLLQLKLAPCRFTLSCCRTYLSRCRGTSKPDTFTLLPWSGVLAPQGVTLLRWRSALRHRYHYTFDLKEYDDASRVYTFTLRNYTLALKESTQALVELHFCVEELHFRVEGEHADTGTITHLR